ncbi:MAG: XRE family transcriptional regulator [Cellvibrionales bacterium]|nr:MAG: XRE family transcriptional regulator [Cellvibrionales bacterium]
MAEVKYTPVRHNHDQFLAKAGEHKGFTKAHESLELQYQVVNQRLKALTRAGMTQDAVAEREGTTTSAVSRLEAAGKHAPSLTTLKRYAKAVGCELQIKLVRPKAI